MFRRCDVDARRAVGATWTRAGAALPAGSSESAALHCPAEHLESIVVAQASSPSPPPCQHVARAIATSPQRREEGVSPVRAQRAGRGTRAPRPNSSTFRSRAPLSTNGAARRAVLRVDEAYDGGKGWSGSSSTIVISECAGCATVDRDTHRPSHSEGPHGCCIVRGAIPLSSTQVEGSDQGLPPTFVTCLALRESTSRWRDATASDALAVKLVSPGSFA